MKGVGRGPEIKSEDIAVPVRAGTAAGHVSHPQQQVHRCAAGGARAHISPPSHVKHRRKVRSADGNQQRNRGRFPHRASAGPQSTRVCLRAQRRGMCVCV